MDGRSLWLLVVVVVACSGPAAPPPRTIVAPAPAPVAEPAPPPPPKPVTCDVDPEVIKHADASFACAQDAMARAEYDTAEALAEQIQRRYPYSKVSVLSEELRADILAARHQYAEAEEAYDHFIKFHPTHERVDEIRRKQAEAHAAANR